jgi:hypothetical protein
MWETGKAILLFLAKKISLVKWKQFEQKYHRLSFVYLALNKYLKTCLSDNWELLYDD